ncbi:hypothetical protein [Ensifer sp. OV372]|uniref:hypothetical protein n=1 Tax=Ensifer sp. OV372 TaxID=1855293 RepID=UPI0008E07A00|nr:hypothetical protein [Ensifer sp. OV372]SFH55897.1 hypothetical protein SAMN05216459_1513 [Ensifer sp. OV372]
MPIRQDYFEIRDLPALKGRSWIPLREVSDYVQQPPSADILEANEFVGVATAAVYSSKYSTVDKFGWSELGLGHHRAGVESWGYHEADVFRTWTEEPLGINLVIVQMIEALSQEIWHLHPDLVLALDLMQEGDRWYRPAEGWIEVVRLKRNEDGRPTLLEIRSEFLGDYLAARDMKLFCSSYSERIVVSQTDPGYRWPDQQFNQKVGRDILEAITTPGRYPHPGDTFWTRGAIWRTEWVEAGKLSTRVRGDKDPQEIAFALKNDGSRVAGSQLAGAMSWLYFDPALVSTLLRYRGSRLHWYSQETGGLGATSFTLHFGVNDLGLITVFAKDIGGLPQWEQRLWSAHNVTPEGGVSRELFAAQMEVKPAATKAPEKEMPQALDDLDAAFEQRYGTKLLRTHEAVGGLLRNAHRFQAIEEGGLLELSKELARLFVERVDVDAVVSQITLAKGEKKPGSLKAIERLLSGLVSREEARTVMAPLFGIYDLRGASSHLGSGLIESGKKRAGVDDRQPAAIQGRQLLQSFVDTIRRITDLIAPP